MCKAKNNDSLVREVEFLRKRVAELEAGEQRYRAALYGIGDGMIVIDTSGNVQQMNPIAEQLTGWNEDKACGQHIDEVFRLVDINTRATVESPVARVLRDETASNLDQYTLLVSTDGAQRPISDSCAPIHSDQGGLTGVALVFRDVSEEYRMQEALQVQLNVFKHMNRINHIIQSADNLDQLLQDVMKEVLNIFGCDRAWLLYPCDPDSPTFRIPVEQSRPEYPGAFILDVELPMKPGVDEVCRVALASEGPVPYGPVFEHQIYPELTEQFGVQAQLVTAIIPRTGKPWLFGMHQCSHAREWSSEDIQLFRGMSRRLTDGLSSLLFLRDLEESESHFRLLTENVSDVIWTIDLSLRFTFVSPSVLQLCGFTVNEAMTRTPADFMVPESLAMALNTLNRKLKLIDAGNEEGWTPTTFEAELNCKDGSTIFTRSNAKIMTGPDGKPSFVVGVTHDVTDRKWAEDSLRESHERYQNFVKNASEGIYRIDFTVPVPIDVPDEELVVSIDKHAIVGEVNEALAKMYGLRVEDMIGRPVTDFAPAHGKGALLVVRAPKHQIKDLELPNVDKNGQTLYMSESYSAVVEEGNLVRIWGMQRDITEHIQAEEALKERDMHLTSLLENPVGYMIYRLKAGPDPMTSIVTLVSPSITDLLGIPMEDAYNVSFWYANVHPDDLPRLIKANKMSSKPPFVYDEEIRFEHPEKGWRWFQARSTGIPLEDDPEKAEWTNGILIDITDRKRAEEELLKEKAFIEAALDSLSGIFYVYDEHGNFLRWNRNFETVSGYSADEIKRMHPADFFPADQHAILREAIQEVFETGWASFEANCKAKDGSTTPYHLTGARFEEDGVPCLVGMGLDLTMRKRTEEALLREKAFTEAALDSLPGAFYVISKQGKYLRWNHTFERVSGYSSDEIKDMNPMNFFLPEEHDKVRAFVRDIFEKGKSVFETLMIAKDGSATPYNFTGARFVEDGEPCLVGMGIDLTKRKQAEEEKARLEEQYRQAQKLESIGRLAGGVAHDLNNLLTPILGYSEILLEDAGADDVRRESLEEIVSASIRARDLVSQLLAFSRKQTLEFKHINLNALLIRFEKLLRRTIREDIAIKLIPDYSIPFIMGDAGQLEQVIMNLVVNAQDAMPDGGELIIETGCVELDENYTQKKPGVAPGHYIIMVISDNGCGMDEETRRHVFEPFFTTKSKEEGTGLGLSTVYGIIKQHNGNIWLYSEPGKGATFKIYLPISGKRITKSSSTDKSLTDSGGSETILLAEDNEHVRNLAKAILTRKGYTVLEAGNGEQALHVLNSHEGTVHLLLTDVVMPEMNGRELYARVAKDNPDMKVLFMSGYTDNVIAHRGVLDPGIAFIQKPFNVQGLTAKVREILDR
ncbi:MAG: PAS domain S-box protein [Candidatus Cloacimonetes bacterium]|nr:PAS domain S-box protein [Candidatus Cloacimonadota bacterium]